MFEAVVVGGAGYAEEVEAWILSQVGVHGQIGVGGTYHIGYFAAVYGLEWVLVDVGTCLYLGKNDGIGVQGYDVNFEVPEAPVAFGYGPAIGHKNIACEVLAPFSELVVSGHKWMITVSAAPECRREQHQNSEDFETSGEHLER